MPDAPLPPLPPAGQPRWRTVTDEVVARVPAGVLLAARSGVFRVLMAAALLGGAVLAVLLVVRPDASAGPGSLPPALPAPAEPAAPVTPARPGPPEEPAEVVVDVTGAVVRPGLVRLAAGSRVADAVTAAGGMTADAAPAGLNQARVVADGEQVRVPRVGEPPPPATLLPTPSGPAAGPPAAPVDLNRAAAADLDTLPGVGPATAAAIIAWRQENGGFRRVEDLLEVPGIGPARLERLRPHVRV